MALIVSTALKELNALPTAMQEKVRAVIARLDNEPALGKKLLGKLAGSRSVRVGRSYRVIYRVAEEGIVVVSIRLRRDAYR